MSIGDDIILSGGNRENDNQRILRAGSLTMIYENGSLRHICLGPNELIRMIYMAVRDRDWLTAKANISEETINVAATEFTINYKAQYRLGEIDFAADFRITGSADNSIEFSFSGEALNSFEKNRIGICVLHPVDLAGIMCKIFHPDGEREESLFPETISPHQPFRDIEAMEWHSGSVNCQLRFTGDVFETEDQRNWTDASYKTYSTPLSVPFPVKVNKGWRTSQKAIFRAESAERSEMSSNGITIMLERNVVYPLPSIGVCSSTRKEHLTQNEISILRRIRFDHYRIEVYLFNKGWRDEASPALQEAVELGYPLTVASFFSDANAEEIKDVTGWLTSIEHPVKSVLLFHRDFKYTPHELVSAIYPTLKRSVPQSDILSGTNANFAQLNRNRPAPGGCDGVCWAIHPQEHASDNLTLVENIEGQQHTVNSARKFSSGKLWVSPVTFRRRFNANRSNYEISEPGNSIPPQVDTRIMSLLGAAWTAGSIKHLAYGCADAVTYFETAGERGIIQGDYPSRWKEFPAEKGMIFPVYFIFRFLFERSGTYIVKSISSHPLRVDCLVFVNAEGTSAILFNFTSSVQEVYLEGFGEQSIIRILDPVSCRKAIYDCEWLQASVMKTTSDRKINIPPYSLIFIEF